MARIRVALRGRGAVPRGQLIRAVASALGHQRLRADLRERIDGHLRAAIDRRVLEPDIDDSLRLAAARLDEYTRDALVDTFAAVTRSGDIYEREQLARLVLDHLGFKRLTKPAGDALESALNAAIRRGLFERLDAASLRRLE